MWLLCSKYFHTCCANNPQFTAAQGLTWWLGVQVESVLGESMQQQLTRARPFLDVHWEMLHHNPSILYFKHITLQIQARTTLP